MQLKRYTITAGYPEMIEVWAPVPQEDADMFAKEQDTFHKLLLEVAPGVDMMRVAWGENVIKHGVLLTADALDRLTTWEGKLFRINVAQESK